MQLILTKAKETPKRNIVKLSDLKDNTVYFARQWDYGRRNLAEYADPILIARDGTRAFRISAHCYCEIGCVASGYYLEDPIEVKIDFDALLGS